MSALLFLAVALAPVYLFPSGVPQPTDWVFVVFIISMLVWTTIARRSIRWTTLDLAVWSFAAWTLLVSLVWSLMTSDSAFLVYPSYYIYNAIVVTALGVYLRVTQHGHKWLTYGFIVSLYIVGIGALFDMLLGVRVTSTLNNPNQLAFYCLLAICAISIARNFSLSGSLVTQVSIGLGVTALVASASAAGTFSLALVAAGYALANGLRLTRVLSILVGFAGVFAIAFIIDYTLEGAVQENISTMWDRALIKAPLIAEQRNYDRILAFLEHWLVGAGEGSYDRFGRYGGTTEIHSTFGNIFFAYGVVGLLLFFATLMSACKRATVAQILVLLAPLMYGVTHMGLRFTAFWILLALLHFHANHRFTQSTHRSIKSN